MVAGTEGELGDQHAPAAPPQLLDRDHAEPQLETELPGGEAPGPDQRGRDGGARRGRDQEGRAIAAEHEGQLQTPGGIEHRGDAGGADQVDVLVAAGARRLGRVP